MLTTTEEGKKISNIIHDYEKNGKYLGELLDKEALVKGYAIHNAGMLPEQKELIEELFQKKLVKVAFATETLSAGINMPARSTVITSLMKPVSTKVNEDGKRQLEPNEFHQMAGRAGRRGIDKKGYTYCMAVNNAQDKGFKKLIAQNSNDIKSHLKTDFSFIANINKNFNSEEFLTNFYEKSLYVYDSNPEEKSMKISMLVDDFYNKKNILKDNGFITSDNKVTLKGELLSKLNGYEQIPVINAIYNQDLKGLNPQQLAGYVAGLAMLSTEEKKGMGDNLTPFEDEILDSKATDLSENVEEYNNSIYPRLDSELYLNTDAMKHVYKWADLNASDDKSTKNWHYMIKGDNGFNIKDEGSLFREITMTTDLLKQINDIASLGENESVNVHDKRYYRNLQSTALDAIELIDRKPAKQDE
ncbi:MAG: helicase-related protein [Candidatus Gastranaerophilaceae bacterium]